jgi:hypothetical protein
MLQHHLIHRTGIDMRAGQVTGALQKFANDFAPGKPEGFLKQLYPLFFRQWMMGIEPVFKRSMLLLQLQDPFGIFNSGFYFKPVAYNTRILHQLFYLFIAVPGYFLNIEIVEGFKKVILFL